MVYVPGDVPALEADDTDDVDEPSGRPVDPDAVEDADLDDLREQVAGAHPDGRRPRDPRA